MLRMSHFTIERAADVVMWLDPRGTVRRVNESVERILGHPRQALLGTPVADLLVGDDLRRFWVARDDQHAIHETRMRRADGQPCPVEIALSHIEFDDEEFNCAVVRDITERKRAEQQLRDALAEVERLKSRLEAENVYLQDEIRLEHNFDEIIGASDSLKRILVQVEQVAPTDATALILGESGTGKELIARAIHSTGDRSDRPLVKVNCAALPANLIESELFGHEKGAFTGAVARRVGRFELADGGTLFLDEIGEMPLELQVKLLRVLQEGEFERLGDTRTLKVDVRVIAATNQNLEAQVEAGGFRADLYYRLNVFPIRLPPLRERTADIPILARHFAVKFSAKMGKPLERISQPMLYSLSSYAFPGNIRELENIIERAVIVAPGDSPILDVPLDLPAAPAAIQSGTRTLREVEEDLIRDALEACSWVIGGKKGAARRLDMPPSTLRERMQRYGISRPGDGS